MKILQLGKFYPVRGGVEKVMYDLVSGLSKLGVECDMMCAETKGRGLMRDINTGGSHPLIPFLGKNRLNHDSPVDDQLTPSTV